MATTWAPFAVAAFQGNTSVATGSEVCRFRDIDGDCRGHVRVVFAGDGAAGRPIRVRPTGVGLPAVQPAGEGAIGVFNYYDPGVAGLYVGTVNLRTNAGQTFFLFLTHTGAGADPRSPRALGSAMDANFGISPGDVLEFSFAYEVAT